MIATDELATDIDRTLGIYWFTNDLRLSDQSGLLELASGVDRLICLYIRDPRWSRANDYGISGISTQCHRFLNQSLNDLSRQLELLGQQLVVLDQSPVPAIRELLQQSQAAYLFRNRQAGWYENQAWQQLRDESRQVTFVEHEGHSLFNQTALPFELESLPKTFTQFRKKIEHREPRPLAPSIDFLPPPPQILERLNTFQITYTKLEKQPFTGGERAAQQHLDQYFGSLRPSSYKETRNAISHWDSSGKFSPWLANGCMSARQVLQRLIDYQKRVESNDSTYWIYFELLWREYFQWYAMKWGSRLYQFKGIGDRAPLTCYYPERFQKWVSGNTPYALVNACMKELAATGYLSNRGRQIVASCFVNELALDWRYGAAYFQSVLLDHDVASNWGNWQYQAGVGADAQGPRHFNLQKQAAQFDADGSYVASWCGDQELIPLDSVDAADWPISSA